MEEIKTWKPSIKIWKSKNKYGIGLRSQELQEYIENEIGLNNLINIIPTKYMEFEEFCNRSDKTIVSCTNIDEAILLVKN